MTGAPFPVDDDVEAEIRRSYAAHLAKHAALVKRADPFTPAGVPLTEAQHRKSFLDVKRALEPMVQLKKAMAAKEPKPPIGPPQPVQPVQSHAPPTHQPSSSGAPPAQSASVPAQTSSTGADQAQPTAASAQPGPPASSSGGPSAPVVAAVAPGSTQPASRDEDMSEAPPLVPDNLAPTVPPQSNGGAVATFVPPAPVASTNVGTVPEPQDTPMTDVAGQPAVVNAGPMATTGALGPRRGKRSEPCSPRDGEQEPSAPKRGRIYDRAGLISVWVPSKPQVKKRFSKEERRRIDRFRIKFQPVVFPVVLAGQDNDDGASALSKLQAALDKANADKQALSVKLSETEVSLSAALSARDADRAEFQRDLGLAKDEASRKFVSERALYERTRELEKRLDEAGSAKKEALKEAEADHKETIEIAKGLIAELHKEKDGLQAENATLKAECSRLTIAANTETRLSGLERDLKVARKGKAAATEELEQARKDNASLVEKHGAGLRAANSAKEALSAKLDALTAEHASEVEELLARAEEAEEELAARDQVRQEADGALAAEVKRLQGMEEQIEDAAAKAATFDALNARIDALVKELDDSTSAAEIKAAGLEARCDELQQALDSALTADSGNLAEELARADGDSSPSTASPIGTQSPAAEESEVRPKATQAAAATVQGARPAEVAAATTTTRDAGVQVGGGAGPATEPSIGEEGGAVIRVVLEPRAVAEERLLFGRVARPGLLWGMVLVLLLVVVGVFVAGSEFRGSELGVGYGRFVLDGARPGLLGVLLRVLGCCLSDARADHLSRLLWNLGWVGQPIVV